MTSSPNPKAEPADIIKAVRHPLRLKILGRMIIVARPLSPSELSGELEEKLSSVAYHVRKLESIGAIELVDEKGRRGSMQHFYEVDVAWRDDELVKVFLAGDPVG